MLYLHVIRLDGNVRISCTNVGYYYWTLHYVLHKVLSRERNTCVLIIIINAVVWPRARREESGRDINNHNTLAI